MYAPDAIEIEFVTASGRTQALAFFFQVIMENRCMCMSPTIGRRRSSGWAPFDSNTTMVFASTELNRVTRLVEVHEKELLRAWNEYFKSGR